MRILVVSRVAWNNSTNFGNTYSSIFKNMDGVEIAHIYFGNGLPNTNVANKFFKVCEQDVLSKLLGKSKECGKEVFCSDTVINSNHLRKFSQNYRLTSLFLIRDFLWSTNVWQTEKLNKFIKDFNPDIIFAPLYNNIYMNKIEQHIQRVANVPMVSFVSDDVYSLKQFHFSPIYWMYRFAARRNIRKTVKATNILYTISQMQRDEYSKTLHSNCKVLYKGDLFKEAPNNSHINLPIKIVFTGNLSAGRWKTLAALANTLKEINKNQTFYQLDIYSLSDITKKIKSKIEIDGVSVFKGAIPGSQIEQIQNGADILLHCESFNLKDKLEVRLSFSTKIVDYFKRGKCILAIGPKNIASIKYLVDNDAAIVCCSNTEIEEQLLTAISNLNTINEYADKAWNCGLKFHNSKELTLHLKNDLLALINGVKNESFTN